MSAQQELIDRLRQHAASAPVISRQSIDMDAAADRLASLETENARLKAKLEAKLAGVDEKGLEAAAKAIWAADGLDRKDDNAWDGPAVSDLTRNMVRAEARAAIAAYLTDLGLAAPEVSNDAG